MFETLLADVRYALRWLRKSPAFTLLAVAAIFGVVNSLVKPLFKFVSAPLILITLGLFLLVVNALEARRR